MTDPEISIILPCLNEEKGIGFCLDQITEVIDSTGLNAEVIIVDNASTDSTAAIVREYMTTRPWLRLEYEPIRGYGSAYLRGWMAGNGKYLYKADADGTYDFAEVPRFLEKLKAGSDMVVGNRFMNGMAKKVMPWHNRYIGNPILSGMVRLFFKVKIHDIHCGARAISKKAFQSLTLYTRGMEFASELIIKASKAKLSIVEIPITYHPRIGESKLNSFSDGWRHLRFILLYSPLILFMLPGIFLFMSGVISMALLYFGNISFFNIQLYVHPMFLSALILLLGYQLILFGGFAKTYAVTHLGDTDKTIQSLFKHLTIEKAGVLGLILALIGVSIYIYIYTIWSNSGFGSLDQIKNSIVAITFAVLGMQTFFSAFMLSIIGIKEK